MVKRSPTTKKDCLLGVLSDKKLTLLAYQLFLATRLDSIRTKEWMLSESNGTQKKATFQIVPQMTMKRRCVTFGREQTTELLHHMAKQELVADFITEDMIPSYLDLKENALRHLTRRVEQLEGNIRNVGDELLSPDCIGAKLRTKKEEYIERCTRKLEKVIQTLTDRRRVQVKRKHKGVENERVNKKHKTCDNRTWQDQRDDSEYVAGSE